MSSTSVSRWARSVDQGLTSTRTKGWTKGGLEVQPARWQSRILGRMKVTRVGGHQAFYTQGLGGPKSSTRFQEDSPLVHALREIHSGTFMWNVPAIYSLIPCRTGSDRSGGRKSHYGGPTFWGVTWQPVGRFMCSWMRWKALSELYAAAVVCQWCHVTLPPSSKTQSSRCGFELKAHIHYVQRQYYLVKNKRAY